MSKNSKNDRKGRPKTTPTISPPIKNENFIVIIVVCLNYVSQLTVNNKKGSRKDCGFAIYDGEPIQEHQSLEQFAKKLSTQGFDLFLRKAPFIEFIRILQGVGPMAVFFELLKIFHNRIETLENNSMEEESPAQKNTQLLDKEYPYLRFSPEKQNKLGTEFQQEQPEMRKRMEEKWDAFVTILEDSIENQWIGISQNKYEKLITAEQMNLNMIVFLCKKSTHSIGVQTQNVDFFNNPFIQGNEKEQDLQKLVKDMNLKNPAKVESALVSMLKKKPKNRQAKIERTKKKEEQIKNASDSSSISESILKILVQEPESRFPKKNTQQGQLKTGDPNEVNQKQKKTGTGEGNQVQEQQGERNAKRKRNQCQEEPEKKKKKSTRIIFIIMIIRVEILIKNPFIQVF